MYHLLLITQTTQTQKNLEQKIKLLLAILKPNRLDTTVSTRSYFGNMVWADLCNRQLKGLIGACICIEI